MSLYSFSSNKSGSAKSTAAKTKLYTFSKQPTLTPEASIYANRNVNNGGILGGIGYVGEKIGLGALQGVEGAIDFTTGGVAKLLGLMGVEGANEFAENTFANDWLNYNHADDWYNPSEGWKVAGDVGSGIGTTLLAVGATAAVAAATSGASLIPTVAGLAVTGLSAAGTSTKEAYMESGNLGGKEFAYGTVMGGVEAGMEAIGGKILGTGVSKVADAAKSLLGKSAKTVAKSGAKAFAIDMAKEFGSEAFEEGFSTFISPWVARATYDPNAENATAEEIAYSALVGGLSGVVMGGTTTGIVHGARTLSGTIAEKQGKTGTIMREAEVLSEEGATTSKTAEAIRETYGKLKDNIDNGGNKVNRRRLLGELNSYNKAAVALSGMVKRSGISTINNAEAVAQKLATDGRYKIIDDKFTFVEDASKIPEGATVRDVTAEDITKGYNANTKDGIGEALKTNEILRYIAASDAAGRFMMGAKEIEAAALKGEQVRNEAEYNRLREEASAEERRAIANEIGVEDINTTSFEDFNTAVQSYKESGKADTYVKKAAKIEEMKKLSETKAKSIPKAIALADGNIQHYADANIDIAIARDGDSFIVYDYKTGNYTRSMTRAEVNAMLAKNRVADVKSENSKNIENLSSDEGTIFDEKKFSEKVLKENAKEILKMDNVAQLSGNEFSSSEPGTLKEKVLAFFNSFGNKVDTQEIGTVAVTQSSFRDDKAHGLTRNKVIAFKAVKEVLENGMVVDVYHPDEKPYLRITIAAPIQIATEKFYMGVMVQKDTQSNRMYLHDVITEKATSSFNTEPTTENGEGIRDKGHLYITNILQKALEVNRSDKNNSKNSSDIWQKGVTESDIKAESDAKAEATKLDALAKEKIKDYDHLSKANRLMVRDVIREALNKGLSEADALTYARVSARTGLDISFDKQACYKGKNKAGEDVYYAGYYDPDANKIVVNPETNKKHASLLIHELSHATRAYLGKDNKIHYIFDDKAYTKISEDMQSRITSYYADQDVDVSKAELILDESTAYYAESLFGTDRAIDLLLGEKQTLKEKILSFFKGAAKDYAADPKLAREARKQLKAFTRLFDNFSGRNFGRNAESGVAKGSYRASMDIGGENVSVTVDEDKDLIAIHNLTEQNLLDTLNLGGFPMPSIAIIRKGQEHSKYGDISVIFGKETIDPKNSKYNKVYGGDAWTATYPRIEYKANAKVAKRINDKYYELEKKYGYDNVRAMYAYANELEERLNGLKGEEGLLEEIYDSTRMMQVYLLDIGKGRIETVTKEIRKEMTPSEVKMNEFFIKELGEEFIDAYKTPSGASPFTYVKEYVKENEGRIKEAFTKYLTEEANIDPGVVEKIVEQYKPGDYAKLLRDAYRYRHEGAVTVKVEDDPKATEAAIRKAADNEQYREWVDSLFKGAQEKTGIRNSKNYYDDYGNSRSWEQLHYENTIDNVIRVMREQVETGGQTIFSGNSIWGVAAKEYNSIDEVKTDKERLKKLPKEEYKAMAEELGGRLEKIAQSIKSDSESNVFIAVDNAMSLIVDCVRECKTKASMLAYLKRYNKKATVKTVDDIVSLVRDIANMPTGYFEAKPRRAVDFSEIKMVELPETASDTLKAKLDENNIPYEFYGNTDQQRAEKIDKLKNVRFSADIDTEAEIQYNNFGWVRANNVLTPDEYNNFTTEFAKAKTSSEYDFYITSRGEYMIAVGKAYGKHEGVKNKIVFAKGSIESPEITRIIKISKYNETELDQVRRDVYEIERAGIQQQTKGIFKVYTRFDFGSYGNAGSGLRQGQGYNSQLGTNRGTGGKTAQTTSKGTRSSLTPVVHTFKDVRGKTKRVLKVNSEYMIEGDHRSKYQPSIEAAVEAENKRVLERERRKNKRFSMDTDYLDAVNRGDMETAQRMVDEAAKKAGYAVRGFHATNAEFTEFDISKTSDINYHGKGIYFTNSQKDVESNYENYEGPDPWQKIEAEAYELLYDKYGLSYEDTLTSDSEIIDKLNECYDEVIDKFKRTLRRITAYLKFDNPLIIGKREQVSDFDMSNYDGIIDKNVYENIGHSGMDEGTIHYVVLNPKNIKSADPVTYDDDGNVIPLSERFNPKKSDIRYSMDIDIEASRGSIVMDLDKRYKPTKKEAISDITTQYQIQFTNQQAGIEKVLKKNGYEAAEALVQQARAAGNAADSMIGLEQYRIGADKTEDIVKVGEGLSQIMKPIEDATAIKDELKTLSKAEAEAKKQEYVSDFFTYLFHMHNVDRMSLKSKSEAELATLQSEVDDLTARFKDLTQKLQSATDKDAVRKELLKTTTKLKAAQMKVNDFEVLEDKPVIGRAVDDQGNTVITTVDDADGYKVIPFTADESKAISDELLKRHPEFAKSAEEIWNYSKNLNQYRLDTGLITKEAFDRMQELYPHYVPTYREGSANGIAALKGKYDVAVKSTVKGAKGSVRPLLRPDVIIARQTEETVKAGAVNKLASTLYDVAKGTQDVAVVSRSKAGTLVDYDPTQDKPKNNQVTFYKDGEKITMQVTSEVFAGFDGFNSNTTNAVMSTATKANNLFKKLVTSYSPLFILRNAVRDLQDAGINTKYGRSFIKNYGIAFKEIQTNGKYWQLYRAKGGLSSSLFDFEKGYSTTANKKGLPTEQGLKKILQSVENANVIVEQLPRLAEFISAIKSGKSADQAILNAADVTTNFGRSGKLVRTLNRTFVPFLNPSVQGFSKIVRNVNDARKSVKGIITLLIKCILIGMVPMAINSLIYDDDEEYKQLRENDKENNYLIKLPDGTFLKIPRGRVVSVLAGAYNRTSQAIKGEDVDWGEYLENVSTQVSPVDGGVPRDILSPIRDVIANKTWYGTDIENQSDELVAPGERYDESTSAIAKTVGGILNLSPKKINYLIDQYTGVAGDLILPTTSNKANKGYLLGNTTIDPVTQNKLSSSFYDALDQATYVKNSTSGKYTAEEIAEAEAVYKYLNDIKSKVNDLNKAKREINSSSEISNNDKLGRVNDIQILINEYYKQALTDMSAFATMYSTTDDIAEDGIYAGYIATGVKEDTIKTLRYTETLRQLYGAEQALSEYNKAVYEKSAVYNSLGLSYDKFYDFYFTTRGLESDVDKDGETVSGSKRKKVVKALKKTKATKSEKVLMMYLAGYTVQDGDIAGVSASSAKRLVLNAIMKLDVSKEEKAEIAKNFGFKVKNGRIIKDF